MSSTSIRCATILLVVLYALRVDCTIGDFIASGVGISSSATTMTSMFTNVGLSATSGHSLYTNSSSPLPSATGELVSSTQSIANASLEAISTSSSSSRWSTIALSPEEPAANVTSSGDCWRQWDAFWTASASQFNYVTTDSAYKVTRTLYVYPNGARTWTITEKNGEFAIGTQTVTSTYTNAQFVDGSLISGIEAQSTLTTTENSYVRTTITSMLYDITTPQCTLPSYVPECSAQWSSFIAAPDLNWKFQYPTMYQWPACPQANITGAQCQSLIDGYFWPVTKYNNAVNPGYQTVNGSNYWPSTTQFAPGCMLGCQTCAITGETVKLLYFPSAPTTLEDEIASATASPTISAANKTMVATFDNTVLTSPTIYIFYDKLYAANSCGGVGKTYSNLIVPLSKASNLSSLVWWENPQGVATYTTKWFNFTDLAVDPVPDSVYNQMPRCQVSMKQFLDRGGFMRPWDFTCARTLPYEPIIAVPTEVLQLDPEWATCTAWYGGLYDPPKVLTPVPYLVEPTLPGTPTPTGAAPAAGVSSILPIATEAPVLSTAARTTQSLLMPVPESSSSTRHGALPSATPESHTAAQRLPTELPSHPAFSSLPAGSSSTTRVETSQNSPSNVAEVLSQALSTFTHIFGASPIDPTPDGASTNANSRLADAASAGATHGQGADQVSDVYGAIVKITTLRTIDGIPDSLATAANTAPTILITQGLIKPHSQALVAVGGVTVTAILEPENSVAAVAGGSITSGGSAVTISGATISLGPSGLIVKEAGRIHTVSFAASEAVSQALLTIDGTVYTALLVGDTATINQKTLTVSGGAVAIAGATISLGRSGLVVASDGKTSTVPFSTAAGYQQALITVHGIVYTVKTSGSQTVLSGHTMTTSGAVLLLNGTTLSLGRSGLLAGHDGITSTAVLDTELSLTTTFVAGDGLPYTAILQGSAVVIAGTTITAFGPAVTINGATFTLGLSSLVMISEGKTSTTFPINTASEIAGTIVPSSTATTPDSTSKDSSATASVPLTPRFWCLCVTCLLLATL